MFKDMEKCHKILKRMRAETGAYAVSHSTFHGDKIVLQCRGEKLDAFLDSKGLEYNDCHGGDKAYSTDTFVLYSDAAYEE